MRTSAAAAETKAHPKKSANIGGKFHQKKVVLWREKPIGEKIFKFY
jgi:hypothetical protein